MGPTGIIIIVLVVLFVLFIAFISMKNNINRTIIKIDEASAGIDVALQKRYDVLTKMLDVVKAYTKYEKETILDVINLRKGMNMSEKADATKKIDEGFAKLSVVAEAYPELKSSENYKTLQQAIADTEEHLQAARRMFNSNVSRLNQLIVSFPTSIVASSMGVSKRDFYEVEESKKEDVKMDFS